MDDLPPTAQWGSLALVTYIPDPLGSFLDQLRHSLTGEDAPSAHVTILPRRPLSLPVEIASDQIVKFLAGFRSFAVELSSVRRFGQTNVVYVDISEGCARLHALHDALGMGDLAHDEEFEFRPHLTLCCPAPSADTKALHKSAKAAWESASMSRRFVVDEVVCLWLRPGGLASDWRRLWTHNLKTGQTIRQPAPALAATARTY